MRLEPVARFLGCDLPPELPDPWGHTAAGATHRSHTLNVTQKSHTLGSHGSWCDWSEALVVQW